MIKATLVIAVLYFISSIGLANIHEQSIYAGEDTRIEFVRIQHSDLRAVAENVVANAADEITETPVEPPPTHFGVCTPEVDTKTLACSSESTPEDATVAVGLCIQPENLISSSTPQGADQEQALQLLATGELLASFR